MQENYDCIFCVVDLHAITVYQEPEILRQNIKDLVAKFIAVGIDPEKSLIFIQSYVKEHAELAWILNTITPISELERMTQFKDKAKKQKASVGAGLLNYPVLMAADILLYDTEVVPIGEDQLQHVELARVIARKFNNLYGETFKIPEAAVKKESARIMSLSNPAKKMSKSDNDCLGCLDLDDSPDVIAEKIKKAVTDSGSEIIYSPKDKPAISSLLTIYSLFSNLSIKELEEKYKHAGSYAKFKDDLAQVVIDSLAPFQEKYEQIKSDPDYLEKVISQGAGKAREIAQKKIKQVKEKVGLE